MRTLVVFCCLMVSTGLCNSADLDSTAEMLKQLQDSGVMNNVKAELEKMMAEKGTNLQDTILAKEKELRAKINEQLNELEDEEAKVRLHFLHFFYTISISTTPTQLEIPL